jgi:hypothetical protein
MRFIKQNSDITIHDDRHEDLFKELLAIFNGGTVDLKQWLFQLLGESLREFCLAQTLCSIEHKEGGDVSCLISIKIKVELLLDVALAD